MCSDAVKESCGVAPRFWSDPIGESESDPDAQIPLNYDVPNSAPNVERRCHI